MQHTREQQPAFSNQWSSSAPAGHSWVQQSAVDVCETCTSPSPGAAGRGFLAKSPLTKSKRPPLPHSSVLCQGLTPGPCCEALTVLPQQMNQLGTGTFLHVLLSLPGCTERPSNSEDHARTFHCLFYSVQLIKFSFLP